MSLDDRKSVAQNTTFPLPVAPFEHYMRLDDTPEYPMCFVLVVHVSGALDRQAFENALTQSLRRHPLLQSFLRRSETRSEGLCWFHDRAARPFLDWQDHDGPQRCTLGESIDLEAETGLRIWVRRQDQSARVTFQFHHSCVDGIGALQFIGDLLAEYGRQTAEPGQEAPELIVPDPEQLLVRGELGPVLEPDTHTRKKSLTRILWRFGRLTLRRPEPLSLPEPLAQRDQPFPAIVTRILDREACRNIRTFARRKGVTANDIYLWAMFQTLAEWNRANGRAQPRRWLRIGIPVNMRTPLHDGTSAVNVVSYMFLSRRFNDCSDRQQLLQGIHRDTEEIVNRQFGRIFLVGIRYLCRVPIVLKSILRGKGCFTTVILANVGDIRRIFPARFPTRGGKCVAGNVVLERLDGAAPVRPGTRAAVSLGTYAGEVIVNLHCDPRLFSQATALRFLKQFTSRIQTLTAVDD